jgi:hypothetical protein
VAKGLSGDRNFGQNEEVLTNKEYETKVTLNVQHAIANVYKFKKRTSKFELHSYKITVFKGTVKSDGFFDYTLDRG